MNKIYLVRNKKVMLDYDLAEMYAVETKQLKGRCAGMNPGFPKTFCSS
jgi:hypothetical protein